MMHQMFFKVGFNLKLFTTLITLVSFNIRVVKLTMLSQITFLTKIHSTDFTDKWLFTGVGSHVSRKQLSSGKLLFTDFTLVPEHVSELDVTIPQRVRAEPFGAVVAGVDLLLFRRVLVQPVFLKSIFPTERIGLVETVLMHADDSSVLLLRQVVQLRRGQHAQFLLLLVDQVGDDFAVDLVLHLVSHLVLSQSRLESEGFPALVALVSLHHRVPHLDVRQQVGFGGERGRTRFAGVWFLAGVNDRVLGQHLFSAESFQTSDALKSKLVFEHDVFVPQRV